jgi:hypothetical protein
LCLAVEAEPICHNCVFFYRRPSARLLSKAPSLLAARLEWETSTR